MGKTVVAMPNHPKAFFDWGRLVWVSQDDVSYDACVCISLRTCVCGSACTYVYLVSRSVW